MTLSFSQQIGGKPNYFIEKIWAGLIRGDKGTYAHQVHDFRTKHQSKFGMVWDNIIDTMPTPKLHTIRQDKHDRWKQGCLIHPVINNRTANRFQFAPVMKCVSVQRIDIKYGYCDHYGMNKNNTRIDLYIDQRHVYSNYWYNPDETNPQHKSMDILKFAQNDGFESVDAFFNYFNKDFTGKIIHWTELKY